MELFDYMIIGTGLLLIVMGWLCYRFPNIINPYGGMSPERKALVDIKGLKKSVAITFYVAGGLLIVTALLSALKVIGLKMSVYATTVIVLAMLVPMFVAMKKYNSFGRDKTGKGVYGPRLETAPKIVLVILALSVALVVILIAFTIRPLKIEVGEESVSISGMYGRSIPFSEIVSVELIDKLPPIAMRTNGASTRNHHKGHYLLENGEKCMLFVDTRVPLFIEMRTTENLYFLNGTDEEVTLTLFYTIKGKEAGE